MQTRVRGQIEGTDLPELERFEELRKRRKEVREGQMSEREYHTALRLKYGVGKWADLLIRDLEQTRKDIRAMLTEQYRRSHG